MGTDPRGRELSWPRAGGRLRPMTQDEKDGGQEQLVVELNSGRIYFAPRQTVERLFRLRPDHAAAMVASVSPLREALDPSGLPQEASEGGGLGEFGQ